MISEQNLLTHMIGAKTKWLEARSVHLKAHTSLLIHIQTCFISFHPCVHNLVRPRQRLVNMSETVVTVKPGGPTPAWWLDVAEICFPWFKVAVVICSTPPQTHVIPAQISQLYHVLFVSAGCQLLSCDKFVFCFTVGPWQLWWVTWRAIHLVHTSTQQQ